MKQYFVTGTDTHVGKTVASAAILLAMQGCYWKPIQSGVPDDEFVKQLTGLSHKHFAPSIYSLKASLSPDQAALKEGIDIDLNNCELATYPTKLVVEGAGGIFAPINAQTRMVDLMKKLALPIIVVARGTLGTINHTLMTIECLRQNDLTIYGIIFSGELNKDNQHAIEKWGNVRTLFHIPFIENMTHMNFQQWMNHAGPHITESLR